MAKDTVNKIILLGRLGTNPEVRDVTQNGTSVAAFNLATNDGIGDNITTEWHRVVVFGKSAKVIQKYATKGYQLFIEDRLRINKWQDRNGNNQYTTEIVASNFQFIGGGNSSGDSNYQNNQPAQNNNFNQQCPLQQNNNILDFAEINSTRF